MNIYQALAEVMRDVEGVGKKEKNTAPNGGFMFRGIDAVTNAVGPALRKHGVIVVPELLSWDYNTVVVGKNRTEMGHARVTIAFTWFGPEGDSIRSVTAGEAFDSGDKATAKAHSVAFRTAMIQTLCLPTDEPDPDTNTYVRSEAPAPDPLIAVKKELAGIAQENGHDVEWLKGDFAEWSQGGVLAQASIDDLTQYRNHLRPEPTRRMSRAKNGAPA